MKGDFSRQTFRPARRYSAVLQQQGRVALDADFNEHSEIELHRLRTLARDVIGPCGGPKGAAGFKISLDRSGRQLLIGAGRYYVDGLLVENEADCAFDRQPDLPSAGAALEQAVGTSARHLVYLDVWERIITALDDPDLLEPALGGADTSLRLKVVWQVRLAPLKQARRLGCGAHPAIDRRASLEVRTQPGGYSGLENRLYRIEIHSVDDAGGARLKWSRDNASLAMLVDRIGGNALKVAGGAADALARVRASDCLELTDDAVELDGGIGQLAQVATVEPTEGSITLAAAVAALGEDETGVDPSLHPKVRRWDAVTEMTPTGEAIDWVALEDGIEVRFGAGDLQPGDYWLFPARPSESGERAAGGVDWPHSQPQPARRVEHRCCPLAVVELGPRPKDRRVVQDRRRFFAPLAGA